VTDTYYKHSLTVSLYDLDAREEVSCANLFRYFEETAMRGSAHFGFDLEWYRAHDQFWVIRTMQIERACAPRYLDELEIGTWISAMARVRSDRNYLVRRARDGQVLARGIANWVYVDAKQMQPTRIHPEIIAMFDRHEKPALPPIGKVTLHPEKPARFEFSSARRAQFYEADSAQHINNAIYVDWLEEAIRDALRAMGYALALDGATPLPWFYRHALEYARPALPGDEVILRTRLVHSGKSSGVWEQELVHRAQGEQMLRATTTTVWVDSCNRLVPWHRVPRH
jgi:YbgC/YbaW family acyl-CoA thioester hydrolase